jgi:hypothetical protein
MREAYYDEDGKIRVKFDRFEFEQQIMSCWNVTTDLKDLAEGTLEHDLSQDQIANALIGMRELYELRFDKLFRQFEQMVREHGKNFDQMTDKELQDMIEKDLTDRAKKHEKENPVPYDAGWYQK